MKTFNCDCREWTFNDKLDSKVRTKEHTYTVHDCPKLLVVRKPKTNNRTFIWKKQK